MGCNSTGVLPEYQLSMNTTSCMELKLVIGYFEDGRYSSTMPGLILYVIGMSVFLKIAYHITSMISASSRNVSISNIEAS